MDISKNMLMALVTLMLLFSILNAVLILQLKYTPTGQVTGQVKLNVEEKPSAAPPSYSQPSPLLPAPPIAGPVAYILEYIGQKISLTLSVNDVITVQILTYKGFEYHKITILEINKALGTVTLEVASEPFIVKEKVGERKEVDVNNDSFVEMAIIINDIPEEGKATITFEKIAACGNRVCETGESKENCCKDCGGCLFPILEIPAPTMPIYSLLTLYIAIISVSLIVLIWIILILIKKKVLFARKKKRR